MDARGVQLAALFMAGVDTALFINDVCGQPLPWEHCCPWGFFDGKLFQSKLARAARDRAALLDMCEGQVRSRGAEINQQCLMRSVLTHNIIQPYNTTKRVKEKEDMQESNSVYSKHPGKNTLETGKRNK